MTINRVSGFQSTFVQQPIPKGDCPICLDPFDSTTTVTKCNHYFHEACVKGHLNHGVNSNCPICRTPLEEREVVLLNPKPILPVPSAPPMDDDLEPVYQPREQVRFKPMTSTAAKTKSFDPAGYTQTWGNTLWPIAKDGGKLLWSATGKFASGAKEGGKFFYSATGKVASGSLWLTGVALKTSWNAGSYLLALAASQRPLTATEGLAADANEKLNRLYTAQIQDLEVALKNQLADVELSISMADSVYDSSKHNSFVRALKLLAERVNEQFTFFEIGHKNFYDEGLNVFSRAVANVSDSRKRGNVHSYSMSPQKAVQLPNTMADEFVAVSRAIKKAYHERIGKLKAEYTKQYEKIQVELTQVANMEPRLEGAARRLINNLMRQVRVQGDWVKTGVKEFKEKDIKEFNQAIRYI